MYRVAPIPIIPYFGQYDNYSFPKKCNNRHIEYNSGSTGRGFEMIKNYFAGSTSETNEKLVSSPSKLNQCTGGVKAWHEFKGFWRYVYIYVNPNHEIFPSC